MTTVLIVSAMPTMRAGLRALLGEEPGIEVLGALADSAEASAATPQALVIDVPADREDLPGRLAARFPDAAQVLLLDGPEAYTPPGEEQTLPWAALLKDAGAEEIAAALGAVTRGLIVLDPALARQRAVRPAATYTAAGETLTAREQDVLALLALGLPNKTIALRLGISEHTAKFHVGAIMAKLDAASRTEAVTQAARRGLLLL